jgi:hypothetical protein
MGDGRAMSASTSSSARSCAPVSSKGRQRRAASVSPCSVRRTPTTSSSLRGILSPPHTRTRIGFRRRAVLQKFHFPLTYSRLGGRSSALRSARLPDNLIGSPINYANRLIGSPITSQSTGQEQAVWPTSEAGAAQRSTAEHRGAAGRAGGTHCVSARRLGFMIWI